MLETLLNLVNSIKRIIVEIEEFEGYFTIWMIIDGVYIMDAQKRYTEDEAVKAIIAKVEKAIAIKNRTEVEPELTNFQLVLDTLTPTDKVEYLNENGYTFNDFNMDVFLMIVMQIIKNDMYGMEKRLFNLVYDKFLKASNDNVVCYDVMDYLQNSKMHVDTYTRLAIAYEVISNYGEDLFIFKEAIAKHKPRNYRDMVNIFFDF